MRRIWIPRFPFDLIFAGLKDIDAMKILDTFYSHALLFKGPLVERHLTNGTHLRCDGRFSFTLFDELHAVFRSEPFLAGMVHEDEMHEQFDPCDWYEEEHEDVAGNCPESIRITLEPLHSETPLQPVSDGLGDYYRKVFKDGHVGGQSLIHIEDDFFECEVTDRFTSIDASVGGSLTDDGTCIVWLSWSQTFETHYDFGRVVPLLSRKRDLLWAFSMFLFEHWGAAAASLHSGWNNWDSYSGPDPSLKDGYHRNCFADLQWVKDKATRFRVWEDAN